MQKVHEVPDPEPEKQDSGTSSELYNDDLIAQFELCLGQILRVGRPRKRPRKQTDKSNGVGKND